MLFSLDLLVVNRETFVKWTSSICKAFINSTIAFGVVASFLDPVCGCDLIVSWLCCISNCILHGFFSFCLFFLDVLLFFVCAFLFVL